MISHPHIMTHALEDNRDGWILPTGGGYGALKDRADLSEPQPSPREGAIFSEVNEAVASELITIAAECLADFRRIVDIPKEPLENDRRLLAQIVRNGGLGVAGLVSEREAVADRGYKIDMTQEALNLYLRAQRLLLHAKMLLMGTADSQKVLERMESFGADFSLVAKEVVELHGLGEVLIHVRKGVDVVLGLH